MYSSYGLRFYMMTRSYDDPKKILYLVQSRGTKDITATRYTRYNRHDGLESPSVLLNLVAIVVLFYEKLRYFAK